MGRAKAEHRMGRNYLAGMNVDAANAVLAAAGLPPATTSDACWNGWLFYCP